MNNLLIIDCGHNELVSGKESPDKSLREWKFNDQMQYLLKKRCEYHKILVMLTNPSPAGKGEIGLRKRCDIANGFYKANGCNTLFVSIHSNAYLKKNDNGHYVNEFNSARGTETFIASNASSNSKNAAKYIQEELFKTMKSIDSKALDRGVKISDFTVIYKTIMPSILIEYAFYTNREDLIILKNNKPQLIEATMKAICRYFNIEYKPVVVKPTEPKPATKMYKVVIGTYANKENAINQASEAKKKGFEIDIIEV